MHQQHQAFENIVGKDKIARNKQFLLFSQCFLLNQIIVFPFIHIFDLISLFAAEIGKSGKELTLYYTIPTFNDPEKESLRKHCRYQHFLLFPQCFQLFAKQISIFSATFFLSSANCFQFQTVKNFVVW